MEGELREALVVEKTLRGNIVGEKVVEGDSVLMMKLEEGLAVAGQKLGWRERRNQMGFLGLHLESVICDELYCLIMCKIYILSLC